MIEAVLGPALSLLDAYPHAIAVAISDDGMPTSVPGQIPLPREQCVIPRGLQVFSHEGLGALAEAMVAAKRDGGGRARVRFSYPEGDFDGMVTAHFIDARPAYPVLLCVMVPDDASGAFAGFHDRPLTYRMAHIVRDVQGMIVSIDPAFSYLLGWTAAEVVGLRSTELVHPEDLSLALDNWVELTREAGLARRIRLRYRCSDGDYVWLEVTSTNRLADDGGITSDLLDISAEMQAQVRTAEREQVLRTLTESLPIGVLQADRQGQIMYANSRLGVVLGVEPGASVDGLIGRLAPELRTRFDAAFRAALEGRDSDLQLHLQTPAAQARVFDVSIRQLSSRAIDGALLCFTEVTEAVRLRNELEFEATHDSLTGCLNRRAVLEVLEAAAGHPASQRAGLAAVFLDLNGFKGINDHWGHSAGDELLMLVGRRLRTILRAHDAVGRFGGDEFLILFRNVASRAEAKRLGDRVADQLNAEFALRIGTVHVSASVGVSWVRDRIETADRLVAMADTAMYRAKRSGHLEAVLESPRVA